MTILFRFAPFKKYWGSIKYLSSLTWGLLLKLPIFAGSLILLSEPAANINLTTPVPFPNSGFETFPQGGTTDWQWPGSNWVWDSNVRHGGYRSARVSRTTGGETSSLHSAYITVNPSTIYTLSFWLRTQNATKYPRVVLRQYTENLTETGIEQYVYANINNGTNDWTRITYQFQTMPNTKAIRLRLYLYTDTTGTFWFDDFGLEKDKAATYPFQTGFPVIASGWNRFISPTVGDIDNDGDNELLAGGGSTINGWTHTGAKLSNFPLLTGDRQLNCQLAIADLDGNNDLEIVIGTQTALPNGQGRVFAWHHTGTLMSNWPRSVAWNTISSNNSSWVSSVVLADIDQDNALEIIAATTNNASGDPEADISVPNLYAWQPNGSLVSGNWPNWHTTAGFYGMIAVGDLTGNEQENIIAARDHHYLNAYAGNGTSLAGWPIRTYFNGPTGDYHADLRAEFGTGSPILADLENDGTVEFIVIGDIKNPSDQQYPINNGLFVFKPDGTRKSGWETPAIGNGILSYANMPRQAPVVADINSDGKLEIIAATYDGWIRAYKHDKSLLWAVNYTQGEKIFASEPVVGDIDGDGAMEILFGTYVPLEQDSDRDGPVALWGLEANGVLIDGFPLPISTPGVRAAPTLADLDNDGDLEILATTIIGQVFVWDTSTPFDPNLLPWPTGRHDNRRSGTYEQIKPSFGQSRKIVNPTVANKDETVTYTIKVIASAPVTQTVSITDTLPTGIAYVPATLSSTFGVATINGNQLHWAGILSDTLITEIVYGAMITANESQLIKNTVFIDTGIADTPIERTGYLFANGKSVYIPFIFK